MKLTTSTGTHKAAINIYWSCSCIVVIVYLWKIGYVLLACHYMLDFC